MKLRNFKDLHKDMRDDRDIYPKRGSSHEELAIVNLMDVVNFFNKAKNRINYKNYQNIVDSFEQYMHEKFDAVESLLKDCNIEYYENTYNKQLEDKGMKC